MDKQPILSLCIPTNGAVEWILPVIESIYSQEYDNEKFEVVITDNGENSELPKYIARMSYTNLHYRQTDDEGFLNLVSCLKDGRGLFCKMINHRSVMLPGSIAEMVSIVEKYSENKPIIYCSDGVLNETEEIIECNNIDEFLQHLSYYCSWSAGIGFWQEDITKIDGVELNKMFPNTSLLFEIRQESNYIIFNKKYEKMESDAGKGGYDLFHTFAVVLLDIIRDLMHRNRVTCITFEKIKKDLYGFLCSLYLNEVILPTKHTFIISNVRENVCTYYGRDAYYKMVLISYLQAAKVLLGKIVKSFIRKSE